MKPVLQQGKKLQLQHRNFFNFPLHLHQAVELAFVTGGNTVALCDGTRYPLSPGDLFVSFPDRIHGFEEDRAVEGIVLIVPLQPYLSAFLPLLEKKRPKTPVLPCGTWESSDVRELLQTALKDWPHCDEAARQGYLLLIFSKLLPLFSYEEERSANTPAGERVLRYLSEHFTEPITRKELARALHYNESYVSHLFSQSLGVSLPEYLASLRLEEATRLLRSTDHSVSRIALSLGFGSIRSFHRAFRRQTGLSPTEYRKQYTEP